MYFCGMWKNPSIKKYVVCSLLAVILLWACNPEKAYKVRRLHNGHARIAYSYGKRELPTPKATLLVPSENTAAVDRIAEVHPETTVIATPIAEAKTELVEANFTVLQADICDRDPEFYNKFPPPTPRANPFEKYVAPAPLSSSQGNESFLGYIFEDFWAVLLWALVVTLIVMSIIAIIIYGWAVFSAFVVSEVLPTLIVVLVIAAIIFLATIV